MFEVGTIVRTKSCYNADDIEKMQSEHHSVGWNDEMKYWIGKEGTVVTAENDNDIIFYEVKFDQHKYWWFIEDVLETVSCSEENESENEGSYIEVSAYLNKVKEVYINATAADYEEFFVGFAGSDEIDAENYIKLTEMDINTFFRSYERWKEAYSAPYKKATVGTIIEYCGKDGCDGKYLVVDCGLNTWKVIDVNLKGYFLEFNDEDFDMYCDVVGKIDKIEC